jgi:hypothetical protein
MPVGSVFPSETWKLHDPGSLLQYNVAQQRPRIWQSMDDLRGNTDLTVILVQQSPKLYCMKNTFGMSMHSKGYNLPNLLSIPSLVCFTRQGKRKIIPCRVSPVLSFVLAMTSTELSKFVNITEVGGFQTCTFWFTASLIEHEGRTKLRDGSDTSATYRSES